MHDKWTQSSVDNGSLAVAMQCHGLLAILTCGAAWTLPCAKPECKASGLLSGGCAATLWGLSCVHSSPESRLISLACFPGWSGYTSIFCMRNSMVCYLLKLVAFAYTYPISRRQGLVVVYCANLSQADY